jgi:uncharacterized integral membrane protein
VEKDSGGKQRFFVDTKRLIRPWLWVAIACLILVILLDGLAVYIARTYECSAPLGGHEESLIVAVLGSFYFGGFFVFAFLSFRDKLLSQFDEAYNSLQNVAIFMFGPILITMVDFVMLCFFVFTFTSPIIAMLILRSVAISCHVIDKNF